MLAHSISALIRLSLPFGFATFGVVVILRIKIKLLLCRKSTIHSLIPIMAPEEVGSTMYGTPPFFVGHFWGTLGGRNVVALLALNFDTNKSVIAFAYSMFFYERPDGTYCQYCWCLVRDFGQV